MATGGIDADAAPETDYVNGAPRLVMCRQLG
jgi:hypothetical protein